MTTTWAAKVLEGVGRIWAYSYEVNEADNGAEPEDWKTFQTWDVADPYPILGKEYVAVDDALAAERAKTARLAEKAVLWVEQGMVIVAPDGVPQRMALDSYRKQFAGLVRAALSEAEARND